MLPSPTSPFPMRWGPDARSGPGHSLLPRQIAFQGIDTKRMTWKYSEGVETLGEFALGPIWTLYPLHRIQMFPLSIVVKTHILPTLPHASDHRQEVPTPSANDTKSKNNSHTVCQRQWFFSRNHQTDSTNATD
jgi:hypothetical protein